MVTQPVEPTEVNDDDDNDEEAAAELPPADLLTLRADNAQLQQRVERLEQDRRDLEKRAADLGEQTRQYAGAYDKARTEFAAAKERLTRENERMLKRELAKAVNGLLGVLDTLDRSIESARAATAAGTTLGQPFVDGIAMIRGQFEQSLGAMGLQRFDGVGEVFDPNRHQAVTTLTVLDPGQDGVVVHSVGAGALLGDEVVRPASVVVGKYLAVGSEAVN